MKTHYLKSWPIYFQPVWDGKKNFEVRINDRDFQEGDTLVMQEWDPDKGRYTGRKITAKVGFVLSDFIGLQPVFCVMALLHLNRSDPA